MDVCITVHAKYHKVFINIIWCFDFQYLNKNNNHYPIFLTRALIGENERKNEKVSAKAKKIVQAYSEMHLQVRLIHSVSKRPTRCPP